MLHRGMADRQYVGSAMSRYALLVNGDVSGQRRCGENCLRVRIFAAQAFSPLVIARESAAALSAFFMSML